MLGIVIKKTSTRNDLTVDGQTFDLLDKKNANKTSEIVLTFLEAKGYFKK